MRTLCPILLAALALQLCSCDDKPKEPPPSRFAGVTKQVANAKAQTFCDKSYEAGQGPKFTLPPTRPLEGAPAGAEAKGWRWVNLWATWCGPCVEELGLLGRWRDGFAKEGLDVTFELLSIDAAEDEPKLKEWTKKSLPGEVKWIRSEEDFFPWLEAQGIDRNAAIPIHILVAPDGKVRCARVGAIHEQDYGSVRAFIAAAP